MITKEELITVLNNCYNAIPRVDLTIEDPAMLSDKVAEKLIQASLNRPMPRMAELMASTQATDLFKDILIDYSPKLTSLRNSISDLENKIFPIQEKLADLCRRSYDRDNYLTAKELQGSLLAIRKLTFVEKGHQFLNVTKLLYSKYTDGLSIDHSIEDYTQFIKALKHHLSYFELELNIKRDNSPNISHAHLILVISISLQLHSERYQREASAQSVPVNIIHFYSSSNSQSERSSITPHASEYLEGFDSDNQKHVGISFDKTAHGLGSGVYGLGKMSEELIKRVIEDKSYFAIFEISNPLRLVDVSTNDAAEEFVLCESDQLTEISKYLQHVGNDLRSDLITKKKQALFPSVLHVETSQQDQNILHRIEVVDTYFANDKNRLTLSEHAASLNKFKNIASLGLLQTNMFELLKKSMVEWFVDAKPTRSRLLPMPINYVMQNLGYTGIISENNDKFNRGLIALKTDPTDLTVDKVAVKMSPSPSCNRSRSRSYSVSSIYSEQSVEDYDNASPSYNGQSGISIRQNALAPHLWGSFKTSPTTNRCSSAASSPETAPLVPDLNSNSDRSRFSFGGIVFSVFRGRGSHLPPRTNDCSSAATETNIHSSTSDSMSL